MALAGQGKTKGMVAQLDIVTTCNQSLAAIVPRKVQPRFLMYWLTANYRNIRGMASGELRDGLNLGLVKTIPCPLPTVAAQREIATFLDRETDAADALVAKYERLIELLEEKRAALVMQAVTEGLDLAMPMKDSGFEWISRIPSHWAAVPLKYLVSFISGGTPAKDKIDYWDGDVPWASAKDLKKDLLLETEDRISTEAVADARLVLVPRGAVLTVVRGMILARLLPVAIAGAEMTINQDLKALIVNSRMDNEFLAHCLRAFAKTIIARADTSGHGTKVLRSEDWYRIALPVPPKKEQKAIVAALTAATNTQEHVRRSLESAILLVKERRAALITAAVTGQIDVRTYQRCGSAVEIPV